MVERKSDSSNILGKSFDKDEKSIPDDLKRASARFHRAIKKLIGRESGEDREHYVQLSAEQKKFVDAVIKAGGKGESDLMLALKIFGSMDVEAQGKVVRIFADLELNWSRLEQSLHGRIEKSTGPKNVRMFRWIGKVAKK